MHVNSSSVPALLIAAFIFSISTGFRVLIPLFIASTLSVFDVVTLRAGFDWLASPGTVVVLGLAVVIELLVYAIPTLDNAIDALAIPATFAVGSLSGYVLIPDSIQPLVAGLVALTGGGSATALAVGLAKLRLLSTASTAGIGNSLVSLLEASAAICVPLLATFFLGIATVTIATGILIALFWRTRIAK